MKTYNTISTIISTMREIHTRYTPSLPARLRQYEEEYFRNHLCRLAYITVLVQKVARPGWHILDIGSHAGYLAITLKKLGYKVTALDTNRPELDYWAKRYRDHNIPLIIHDLRSPDKIPLSEKADTVLLLEVIEHIPAHPEEILGKVAETLKQRGILILSTPNLLSLTNRLAMLRGKEPFPLYNYDPKTTIGHFREYSPREIIHALSNAGFKIEHIKMIDSHDYCKEINLNEQSYIPPGRSKAKTILLRLLSYIISIMTREALESMKQYYIIIARKTRQNNKQAKPIHGQSSISYP